jgi:hypothetical protein
MTHLPSSPKVSKGAFVRFMPESPGGLIIKFQYNPEQIYRRLETPSDEHELPIETISFVLSLDAAEDLESPEQHQNTIESGIYPSMSALEMLMYPNAVKRKQVDITSPAVDDDKSLTLFIWGNKRIVPVQVMELYINEEAFDLALNPLRATVALKMRVLNDSDLPRDHKGHEYWKTYVAKKIDMAKTAYAPAGHLPP